MCYNPRGSWNISRSCTQKNFTFPPPSATSHVSVLETENCCTHNSVHFRLGCCWCKPCRGTPRDRFFAIDMTKVASRASKETIPLKQSYCKGTRIPKLGLGTWKSGKLHRHHPLQTIEEPGVVGTAVTHAIRSG